MNRLKLIILTAGDDKKAYAYTSVYTHNAHICRLKLVIHHP